MATYERWRMVKYYEENSGFLYEARDNDGNVIFDGDGNVQVNMLVTDKDGFVRIKERVGYSQNGEFIGYDSNLAYWTDFNKKYQVSNINKGKPISGSQYRYIAKKGSYYIAVKVLTYSIEIHVLSSSFQVLQTIPITGSYGSPVYSLMANSDVSELTMVSKIAPKAPPFTWELSEWQGQSGVIEVIGQSITAANLLTKMSNAWEAVFKIDISAEYPFVFTQNKTEQWNGFYFEFEDLQTGTVLSDTLDSVVYTGKLELNTAIESTNVFNYLNDFVFYGYYENNAYLEHTAKNAAFTGYVLNSSDYFKNEYIGNVFPNTVNINIESTESYSLSFDLNAFQFSKSSSYDYYKELQYQYVYPPTINIVNHTFTGGFNNYKLNAFYLYDNVKAVVNESIPEFTVNTDSFLGSGQKTVLANIVSFPESVSFSANTHGFNPLVADGIAISVLADKTTVLINEGTASEESFTTAARYRRCVYMGLRGNFTFETTHRIIADKFGNRLVLRKSSAFALGSDVAIVQFIDKNGSVQDISNTVLNSIYYRLQDFFGAI
jgi:hypothetical protein